MFPKLHRKRAFKDDLVVGPFLLIWRHLFLSVISCHQHIRNQNIKKSAKALWNCITSPKILEISSPLMHCSWFYYSINRPIHIYLPGKFQSSDVFKIASKHAYYLWWNRSPAQVGCMRQVLGPGALGRPRRIGWRGSWEGGSGWGPHVTPWLIHVNVWQNPLQYCKVIRLQLIKKK